MIFYFSGTGNTRYIASRLSQATGEQLISIAQAVVNGKFDYRLEADERIGICFPIHGWRPPFIVRDFVRQLRLDGYNGQFCYAFATCGDDVGLTFDYLRADLHEAGVELNSVFSVIMPETYNFPVIDQVDTPESAQCKIDAARAQFQLVLPDIIERRSGVKHINNSRWPRINSKVLGRFFVNHWVTDAKFTVDSEACTGCGLCSRVCPVGNIGMSDDKHPQWLHNRLCTTCFACYHHCPVHAIDFAGRTRGKRQYYFKEQFLESGD